MEHAHLVSQIAIMRLRMITIMSLPHLLRGQHFMPHNMNMQQTTPVEIASVLLSNYNNYTKN